MLNADWFELSQLSESEQFRFSVAFSVALAEATGVGLVVIDKADQLLAEPWQRLGGMLLKEIASGRLDQAIVMRSEDVANLDEPVNVPEGVVFFHLENANGATEIAGRWDCETAGAAHASSR